MSSTSPLIVVIDNYDSFVYNLVQYLGIQGAQPVVVRNDQITLSSLENLNPDGILISPGPGHPSQLSLSNEVLTTISKYIPTFGVCLGLQCLGYAYGAHIVRAPAVMHGKTSSISHNGTGLFENVSDPLIATRYHSLIVDEDTLTEQLEITARSDDGLIMGLKHRLYPIETVQFHPESVLTKEGDQIVRNFINATRKAKAV